jgi:4-amino-4-deoxy-L-arabinose transferase-like glycosyltransferase
MDDVDAAQAQIARNMLVSGEWVTARLDGVPYLEKSPLIYWMMAVSYRVFGVHDWAARVPLALAIVLLCWVTYRFSRWAFDVEAGLYAGVALSTSVGLFLFTRILIPDAIVTLSITGAIWAWLQLLEPQRNPPLCWPLILGACLGTGLLLKGLIAVVFPVLAGLAYMAFTRCLFSLAAWRPFKIVLVTVIALVIAVPWHLFAILRNPPYFAFSLHSGPGEYRGFFWFYFFNEHLLRFLNLRYPRDYDTVPQLWFWLLNLVWLFPWSVYLFSAARLGYQPTSRAGRTRLMAAGWIGVVMLFFTFSTTQEYYSMPIYPALALLVGSTLSAGGRWVRAGTRVLTAVFCNPVSRALSLARLGLACSRRGQYFPSSDPASRTLHSISGPYGRPDAQRFRLSETSPGPSGLRLWGIGIGSGKEREPSSEICFDCRRRHDRFLPGCADRSHPVRFLPRFLPAGGTAGTMSTRTADRS